MTRLLTFIVLVLEASAQTSEITAFRNGQLTFGNVNTGMEYRVEWMSRLRDTNGFSSVYNSIEYIVPTNLSAMTVDIPQFFRIAGTNRMSNGIVRASDLPTLVNAGTNARINLEWSESPNGPWATNWQAPLEVSRTGSVITVQSPRFFRISFEN